ncbi:hypothetical protein AB7M37_003295 [Sinorhizobium fredii]
MMAGRTAEREGGGIAGSDVIGCRDRAIHRGAGRGKGAIGDRRFGREGIVAERAVDILRRMLTHAPHRKAGRDRLAAIAVGHPARPGGLEKFEIVRRMQLQRRLHAVAFRREHVREARFLDGGEDPFGPERRLEGRHELAAVELGLGVSELVIFGIENAHFLEDPSGGAIGSW